MRVSLMFMLTARSGKWVVFRGKTGEKKYRKVVLNIMEKIIGLLLHEKARNIA